MTDELKAQMLAAAQAARAVAYAPYSKYLVGAALLDDQGRIHAGCNVENHGAGRWPALASGPGGGGG